MCGAVRFRGVRGAGGSAGVGNVECDLWVCVV